ncbi:MAG: 2-amino-4-hydroxy-6-hydroxymethyldihydropteridine diphosphokinase [Vicinamibacterales bacterium]
MARVAVALGSNLGDRETTLRRALDALGALLTNLRASSFHDTEPVGVPSSQAPYLNAAAVGETAHAPRALLEALQAIEQQFGRERPYVNAPRTLDLDLILYADRVIDEPGLIVPHPRFRERAFVLDPLTEIAADWIDPVTGVSVAALKQRLPA